METWIRIHLVDGKLKQIVETNRKEHKEMKKVLSLLTALVLGLGIQANATVYFQSDFNGLATSTKSINGGLLTLTAYGEPGNWGIIRDDALTIYGGGDHNGASSARLVGLGADLAAGKSLLRISGEYRTKNAYSGAAFATTAKIEYQNNTWYFDYNKLTVNSATPDWTAFNLDLNLAGLATDAPHIDMINLNFYIGGSNPGELQVDNLLVQTVVPEPSSATLMGLGVAGLLAFRLRRKV